jgi:hypothetical protein
MTHLGQELLLSWEEYDRVKQDQLTPNDLVVFLQGTIESPAGSAAFEQVRTRAAAAKAKGCKVACISIKEADVSVPASMSDADWLNEGDVDDDDNADNADAGQPKTMDAIPWDVHVVVSLPTVRLSATTVRGLSQGEGCMLAELGMKLVLNAVTTGGHVLAGKIMYGSRFQTDFALEDVIGSQACSLEADMRVTDGISLGSPLLTGMHCKLRPNTEGQTV